MREDFDTLTRELPGIPPAPVAPPKTTQADRIAQMGYVAPKARACCANCKHFEVHWLQPDTFAAREMPRCSRGDFPVLRGGVCNEHAPVKRGGAR